MNPFRKISRAATVPVKDGHRDLEAAQGIEDQSPLSHVQSEPLPRVSNINGDNDAEKESRPHGPLGQASRPNSEKTVEESELAHRASEEDKPRRRAGAKFWRRNENDAADDQDNEEDRPKKRPWYKGKLLAHKEPFTVRNQLSRTIFGSWVNILLLAAPAGIALNYAKVDGKAIFVVNFIAIVPLAGMLGFATEEIALHVGESLGGLLNATFG